MRTLPHHRRGPRNAGFTLIEMMVSLAVMTVMLIIVTQIFIADYDIVQRQIARTDVDTGTSLAVRTISQLARGAIAVLGTQTVNGTSYTSSSSVLVLKMPSVSSSGAVLANTYDYVAFARDGSDPTKLYADVQAASGSVRISLRRLLSPDVSLLTFRYNASDITKATRVETYLVDVATSRGSTLTSKAWTALFFRNTTF
ncbi:MAG TPA: prepilin-type N-terminal cleavage/methylation domain-containing protein [Candidatus Binatia bacterium]|jgi:prepilin-type N-terminal cleavage/methylation domain-containing protein|nr:prepilin-type N-terminal cleavage/methylation domain-containing protein [Candidatus Binatia bacterium]